MDVTVGQEVHLPGVLLEVPLGEPVLVAVAHAITVGVLRVRVRGTQQSGNHRLGCRAVLPRLELGNRQFSPALLVEQNPVDPIDRLIGIQLLGLLPHPRCIRRGEAAVGGIVEGEIQLDEVGDAVAVRVVVTVASDQRIQCPDLVGRVPPSED